MAFNILKLIIMQDILQRLKKANQERAKHFPDYIRFVNKDFLYYSNALAGESGETCNVVKKICRGDTETHGVPVLTALSDEIADVLIQLDLLCQVAGIDLSTALVTKFNCKSVEIGSKVFL